MEVTSTKPFDTVIAHSAVFPSAVAYIVVLPSAKAVTRPVSETEATDFLLDDHVTSLWVALEGDTVALSWMVSPISISAAGWFMETRSTGTSDSSWVHDNKVKIGKTITAISKKDLFIMLKYVVVVWKC